LHHTTSQGLAVLRNKTAPSVSLMLSPETASVNFSVIGDGMAMR